MTKLFLTIKVALTAALLSIALSAFGQDKAYDAQFLDKMTEHHRQGIEMAEMAKEKAKDSELKKMSAKMVKDQTKEIAQMEKWRKSDFAKESKASDLPPKMDMSPLKTATAAQFDHQFISMMTKHHDDGINMAREAEQKATTEKVKTFAKNIVKNQTMEKEKLSKLHSGPVFAH